jgi:peptidoglycan/LPS O-acetylase OafA/YrhL
MSYLYLFLVIFLVLVLISFSIYAYGSKHNIGFDEENSDISLSTFAALWMFILPLMLFHNFFTKNDKVRIARLEKEELMEKLIAEQEEEIQKIIDTELR